MKIYIDAYGERSYSSVYTTDSKKILNEILQDFNFELTNYHGSSHDRRGFRRNYEIEYDGYFSYTYDGSIAEVMFYMNDCSIEFVSKITKDSSHYSKRHSKSYHSYTRIIHPKYGGKFGSTVYVNYYRKKMKIKLGSVRS